MREPRALHGAALNGALRWPRGSGSGAQLPAEVFGEDFEGGGLVDDGLLLLGVFAGLVEFFGGGDGGEAFVEIGEGDGAEFGAELFAEFADFGGGGAFGAIHAEGEAEDDGFNFSFRDDCENARDDLGLATVDGLDGMGTDTEFISGSEANAGFTMVDGEDRVVNKFGHCRIRRSDS